MDEAALAWWEQAKQVYGEQGYLVCPVPAGFTFDHLFLDGRWQSLPQPFCVVSEATFEEFRRQADAAGWTNPDPTLSYYRAKRSMRDGEIMLSPRRAFG